MFARLLGKFDPQRQARGVVKRRDVLLRGAKIPLSGQPKRPGVRQHQLTFLDPSRERLWQRDGGIVGRLYACDDRAPCDVAIGRLDELIELRNGCVNIDARVHSSRCTLHTGMLAAVQR